MKVKKIVLFLLAFLSCSVFCQNGKMDFIQNVQKNGISFYWDPMTSSGLLEKNGHRISFRAGDLFFIQDYKTLVSEAAPFFEGGKLVSTSAFFNLAENFFKLQNSETPYKIGAILIDPGHGGKDPGASSTHVSGGKKITVVEKDINLKVGLMLRDYLKKAYPEKNILMTRSTDVFLTLSQRTEIANSVKLKENEAILYVSVHVNSSMSEKVTGYEVWYLSPGYRRQVLNSKSVNEDASILPILNSMTEEEYTTESILMAKFIMNGIAAQVGNLSNSRGIKEEEWFVVRNSNMPSVLIELGFLSNKNEGLLLNDTNYLQKLSLGIYNGLQEFVTNFERTRGFTGN
ncbi:N-acetylmuramoyl-L-alanine amidase family protein [Treponema sp.]|uniref:N-acetylmuramoyl-L-alanine amidase family protein n=1 Tax=Treponema sp. TaxID=166 RepID=UPI003F0362FE